MARKLYHVKQMRRTCAIQYDRNGMHHTGWEVYIPSGLTPGGWHNSANWWPEYESADGEQSAYCR